MPFSYTSNSSSVSASPAAISTAHSLARYAAGSWAIPLSRTTRDTALKCLLDVLTSAGAALDLPGVMAAREGAVRLLGPGHAPIWFTGDHGSLGAALVANSAATAALDLDDGYRRARGHPGAAVIPAALAVLGTDPDLQADTILAAIVAGYEVALRVAIGRPSYAPSGAWSPYGVIAVIGRLHGASAEHIAHALAIAAQAAPGLPALAGIAGSDVKEGIPYGCLAGLAALEMARAGATGPLGIFDDPALFDAQAMLEGLGGTPLIEGVYFKPYGCCRHIHGALDAFLALRQQQPFEIGDIVALKVHTYRATFNLANRAEPASLVDAQYSVPFCMAAAAAGGERALLPLKPSQLCDPHLLQLAQRVTVHHDPMIEPLFPARSPSRVTVVLKGGQCLDSPVVDPRGDPIRPLTWEDLVAKFRQATAHTLGTQQQTVLASLEQFAQGNTAPLKQALALHGTV
ncbi:MmgE/PrpD family protein [Parapusillimonas granuli]|uniref:MmgE/PrpD family protein n=1 Tax=Parapusillimonas granuli TaxID=380911 RepID=A0A853G265_9BURK|nr:MmgE/PrpD family protein [Parapusillimonas granuli]MBB5213968.1 2-methylcitrate dehydratase PrpD [Parapusillimonas granuli]NYT50389.1 MmgE/PrpD family protein [Parapusillimonas granuli]